MALTQEQLIALESGGQEAVNVAERLLTKATVPWAQVLGQLDQLQAMTAHDMLVQPEYQQREARKQIVDAIYNTVAEQAHTIIKQRDELVLLQHRFDDAIEAMDRLEIESARLAQERDKWKLAAETTNILLKDIF